MKIRKPIKINYDNNTITYPGEYVYFNDKLYICEEDILHAGCRLCDFNGYDGTCMITTWQCDCDKYDCSNLIFKLAKDER